MEFPRALFQDHSFFLIYINDLHLAIKNSLTYHFADDTGLLLTSPSLKTAQKKLNYDLKFLYKWLLANKISLNETKTELISFSKPTSKADTNIKVKINGYVIPFSNDMKYLGVYIDKNLSGNKHCQILIPKLRRAIGIFKENKKYCECRAPSLQYLFISSYLRMSNMARFKIKTHYSKNSK